MKRLASLLILLLALACGTALAEATLPTALTEIEAEAFRNDLSLREVTIPVGCTTIGDYAFSGCANLLVVKIPKSVTVIGEHAFDGCDHLTFLPTEGEWQGHYAYRFACYHGISYARGTCGPDAWWRESSSVDLEHSILDIEGTGAVNSASTFPTYCDIIRVGDGITGIDLPKNTFSCWFDLSVYLPDSLTSVSSMPFHSDKALTIIAPYYSYAGRYARDNGIEHVFAEGSCGAQTTWRLSRYDSEDVRLTIKGNGALEDSAGYMAGRRVSSSWVVDIVRVNVGKGVTGFPDGRQLFGSWVESVDLMYADDLSQIGAENFADCTRLEKLWGFSGAPIRHIGAHAFDGCQYLKVTDWPSTLETIGDYAFFDCDDLVEVKLSEGLQSIGDYAFANADELRDIYLPITLSSIGEHAFSGVTRLFTAHVYARSFAHRWCVEHQIPFVLVDNSAELEAARAIILEEIGNIVNPYLDENGFISFEDREAVISDVSAYLDQAKAELTIIDYTADEYGILFIDAARLEFWYWTPPIEGMLAAGADLKSGIVTLEAFSFGEDNRWGTRVQNTFSDYREAQKVALTPENLMALGPNQVIIILSHGGFVEESSFQNIALDIPYTDDMGLKYRMRCGDYIEVYHGTDYDEDSGSISARDVYELVQPEMIHCVRIPPNNMEIDYLGITPYFIQHYMKRLDNSLVWLGCCHSAQANDLANAFISKGATAVVGYSDETLDPYNKHIMDSTFEYLCKVKSSTGKHYTLSEALDMAKFWHGSTDSVEFPTLKHARPLIKPDNSERALNYRLTGGTLSGQVFKADGVTPLSGITVRASRCVGSAIDGSVTAATDAQGRYSFGLPVGTYAVQVEGEGLIPQPERRVNVESEETTAVNWSVQYYGRLTGKVTAATDGSSMPGVTVQCRADNKLLGSVTTDALGRYTLYLTKPDAVVSFSRSSYSSQSFEMHVPTDTVQEKDVAMEPAKGTITGYIRDDATGLAIQGASITLVNENGDSADVGFGQQSVALSQSNGLYLIYIDNGDYTMYVYKDGYALETQAVSVDYGSSQTLSFRLRAAATGEVRGKVCRASDLLSPIPGASLAFYAGSALVKALEADEAGALQSTVPEGDYRVVVSAVGYLTMTSYFTVHANETNYFETYLMVADGDGTGTARGSVLDAYSGGGVAGATLVVRQGWNNRSYGQVVQSAVADESGAYTLELPLGNYTVTASQTGYITGTFNIVVNPGTTDGQNGVLEREDMDPTSALITLTWGASPRDLDAYMTGAFASGDSFLVYYSNKTASLDGAVICSLDTDKRGGYGPEHITLKTDQAGTCYFYVHNYSKETSLSTSQARVSVTLPGASARVFNVPTDQPDGYCWNVFAISDGRIIPRNSITSSPETGYAQEVNQ